MLCYAMTSLSSHPTDGRIRPAGGALVPASVESGQRSADRRGPGHHPLSGPQSGPAGEPVGGCSASRPSGERMTTQGKLT